MNPPPAPAPQFLILLHQPHGEGPGPTPAELQQIMAKFGAWMKSLNDRGHLLSSHGLETTGKVLRLPGAASMTDGPYVEAREIVGGYILISADSLDHATEIARGCPGLDHRLAVEVRPIRTRPPA